MQSARKRLLLGGNHSYSTPRLGDTLLAGIPRAVAVAGIGLGGGYGLPALQAQVHGNVVADAALARLAAAQDGIDQAAGHAKAAGQFGFG